VEVEAFTGGREVKRQHEAGNVIVEPFFGSAITAIMLFRSILVPCSTFIP